MFVDGIFLVKTGFEELVVCFAFEVLYPISPTP